MNNLSYKVPASVKSSTRISGIGNSISYQFSELDSEKQLSELNHKSAEISRLLIEEERRKTLNSQRPVRQSRPVANQPFRNLERKKSIDPDDLLEELMKSENIRF